MAVNYFIKYLHPFYFQSIKFNSVFYELSNEYVNKKFFLYHITLPEKKFTWMNSQGILSLRYLQYQGLIFYILIFQYLHENFHIIIILDQFYCDINLYLIHFLLF